MIHFEELPYSYKGFHEGEYLHRYYLPESLRSEISPRDLLVVYWILRGFTPRTHPKQMRPAAFREPSSIRQANDRATALLDSALTINYSQEQLSRVIPVGQVTEMVVACHSYMQALADTELDETETNLLIGLNKRLRGLQHDVAQRVVDLNLAMQDMGESCDMKVRYSFELRDDDPDYRELDHNTVFSFTDEYVGLEAGLSEAGIEEMWQRDSKDCNKKRHSCNRLYQTPHCWLFNRLEDLSAAPLHHLLRVGQVTAKLQLQLDV